MKCNLVVLFFSAVLVTVVKASVVHRQERQVWGFPEDPVTSVNIPARPGASTTTTTRRTTAATASTTAAGPGMSTSTPPPGVIFQVKDCNCPAPPQFNPVCGTDGNTYVNRQKLVCARRCGYDVQEARMGAC